MLFHTRRPARGSVIRNNRRNRPAAGTIKDGKFRIDALVPGLKYTMRVTNKGRLAGTVFEDLKVKPGETKDLGDVRAKE